MASTPSASALSAVLRCRGKLWTRNPPTKRPTASVYSLGIAGGVARISPAERDRAPEASAWEAFLKGERVSAGSALALELASPRVDVKVRRGKDSRRCNTLCHPKLSQSLGDTRSAVPGVQNPPARQLARRLLTYLPDIDTFCKITRTVRCETLRAHVCKIVIVQEFDEYPAGALKVSIRTTCSGQGAHFVSRGWSTLKRTCFSLTALVSEFMLGVLCGSSSRPNAPQHHLDEKNVNSDARQVRHHILMLFSIIILHMICSLLPFFQVNGQIRDDLVSTEDNCDPGKDQDHRGRT